MSAVIRRQGLLFHGAACARASAAACAVERLEDRLCLAGQFDIENDVVLSEGSSGTVNFTFNVTWRNFSPFDSLATVRVITEDGTAAAGDGDYVAQNTVLAFNRPIFQTTPVTRQFTVAVNGDRRFEPDEVFTVRLLQPSNASINTGTRTGTILNDDPDPGVLTVNGTAGPDVLVLTATSADDGSYSLNNAPAVPLSNVRSFTFNAGGGDDLLRINNPSGALFAPTGGVTYNGGGQAGDALENLGGAAASGTYAVGPTTDAGTVTHAGAGTQILRFTGLAPLTDTVTEPNFTVTATDAANTVTLDDGTAAGDGMLRVSVDAFEPVQFANKTTLTVDAGVTAADGADVVNVAFSQRASRLANVLVRGGAGADTLIVRVTAAGVVTIADGGVDNDTFYVNSAGVALTGDLGSIAGAVTVWSGAGAGNVLHVSDVNSPAGNSNAGISFDQIFGLAGPANEVTLYYDDTEGGAFSALNVGGSDLVDHFFYANTGSGVGHRIIGNGGDDTFTVDLGRGATFVGHDGSDTLEGPESPQVVWTIRSPNYTSIRDELIATEIENLRGRSQNDRFLIDNAVEAELQGFIDGGGGSDELDYRGYNNQPVAVNLGLKAPGLAAELGGEQVVPARRSAAAGTATLAYDNVARNFDVTLTVTGVTPSAVSGLRLRRGPTGVNGPVVVDFMPGGTSVAPLVATSNGFTFTANDVDLGFLHEAALIGGLTYLELQTAASPGGEIRGQVLPTGPLVAAPARATAIAGGVRNIRTVLGTLGDDSLVGTVGPDGLVGRGGNDTLVGGGGGDDLAGDEGDDLFAWIDGDGSDTVGGAAGNDALQATGSASAADLFTFAPGPAGRLDLDRPSGAAASLDVGEVETVAVNSLGGDDTFSVAGLAGVSSLAAIHLSSGDGSDTFTLTPAAGVTMNVTGSNPPAPAAPGDVLRLELAGVSGTAFTPQGLGSGRYGFTGRQPVNFTGIEHFPDGTGPNVTAAAYQYQFGSPHRVAVSLSENAFASLQPSDLFVQNLSTGGAVAVADVTYDVATHTAFFNFSGVLPNGNYRATVLAAGIADPAGNAMPAGHTLDFYALAGDINRDRRVDSSDFATLARNFGKTGMTYDKGDLNGDGKVDSGDFAILAGNFGKSVAPPAPAVVPAPTVAAAARASDRQRGSGHKRKLIGQPAPRPTPSLKRSIIRRPAAT